MNRENRKGLPYKVIVFSMILGALFFSYIANFAQDGTDKGTGKDAGKGTDTAVKEVVDVNTKHRCYRQCIFKEGKNRSDDIIIANTRAGEITRIRNCLTCLSRAPKEDEKTLYTYSPTIKLREMVTMNKNDYYRKLYILSSKREEAGYRLRLKKDKSWQSLYNGCRLPKRKRIIKDILKQQLNLEQVSEILKDANFKMHNEISEEDDRLCYFAGIIGLCKIYEEFYENAVEDFVDPADELKDIQKELEKKKLPLARMRELMAKEIGIKIVINDSNFRPSTTYGYGIYMSSNPHGAIHHVGNDYGGMVCDITGLNQLVNINNNTQEGKENKSLLVATRILIFKGAADLTDPATIANMKLPGGILANSNDQYNNFLYPEAFEEAARGFIIRFQGQDDYYVSKYAIDFNDQGKNKLMTQKDIIKIPCHNITAENFAAFGKKGFVEFLTYGATMDVRTANFKELMGMFTTCLGQKGQKSQLVIKGLQGNKTQEVQNTWDCSFIESMLRGFYTSSGHFISTVETRLNDDLNSMIKNCKLSKKKLKQ